jgi:hypothetical protein
VLFTQPADIVLRSVGEGIVLWDGYLNQLRLQVTRTPRRAESRSHQPDHDSARRGVRPLVCCSEPGVLGVPATTPPQYVLTIINLFDILLHTETPMNLAAELGSHHAVWATTLRGCDWGQVPERRSSSATISGSWLIRTLERLPLGSYIEDLQYA